MAMGPWSSWHGRKQGGFWDRQREFMALGFAVASLGSWSTFCPSHFNLVPKTPREVLVIIYCAGHLLRGQSKLGERFRDELHFPQPQAQLFTTRHLLNQSSVLMKLCSEKIDLPIKKLL